MHQKGIVEALIFSSPEPIGISEISAAANLAQKNVENIITELNQEYIANNRSFRIENVADGYKMFTLPEYHQYVTKANRVERSLRLSNASLETLAIIAYKQPVTKVEIERIRGVDCDGVLKNLISKALVRIEGRSPAPGKPLLYTTSEYFLEFFGLPSLEHLPPLTEIDNEKEGLPKLKLVKKALADDSEAADEDIIEQPISALNAELQPNQEAEDEMVKVGLSLHEGSSDDK